MIYLVFRCCTRNESQVHGTERLIKSKSEITLKCLKSILESAKNSNYYNDINVIVIDDHSPEKDTNYMKSLLEKYMFNKSTFINLNDTGNSASLHYQYDFVKSIVEQQDLIYFIEDDYLHEETAIDEMLYSYYTFRENLGNRDVAIFPLDCNDRYKPYWMRPSYIVPGRDRYWRTIDSTTGTHLLSYDTFKTFFNLFKKFADYGVDPEVHEESTINNIWRHQNGPVLFSPIPTLAYHLQIEEHLPFYTNYRKVWDNIELW